MAGRLLTHRCWNHGERLAVARCPACSRYFCRECVTEHEGRMMCSTCVRAGASPVTTSGLWWRRAWRGAQAVIALFVVWLVFLTLGRALLSIPSSVHEGTLWADEVQEEGRQ